MLLFNLLYGVWLFFFLVYDFCELDALSANELYSSSYNYIKLSNFGRQSNDFKLITKLMDGVQY